MTGFLRGLWVVVTLELRQRVRGVAWYVLLGVFVAVVAIVTLVLTLALGAYDLDRQAGGGIFSTIVYFVLLLGTLVAPALSGNAINGDRDTGTLATTQVTLLTTGQIVLGKFVAAWITALAFLAGALPFLLIAMVFGGLRPDTIIVSILVLAIELGVVAAAGVGLSGLLRRPLFSVVVTYLLVAALSVGTLIAFALSTFAVRDTVTYDTYCPADYVDIDEDLAPAPGESSYTTQVPRTDLTWWLLAANPYVVVADAAPTAYDSSDRPTDLFGYIKLGVRQLQVKPDYDPCRNTYDPAAPGYEPNPTAREVIDSTVPSWFVGLLIHVGLGAAALAGAVATTRAPSRRLAAGSRVA